MKTDLTKQEIEILKQLVAAALLVSSGFKPAAAAPGANAAELLALSGKLNRK